MRKILFIGCGGSGGAVLGYLMDQLHADLRRVGIDNIPRGWQFLHFDAPLTAPRLPGGLGSLVDQGGTYVPLGPTAGTYEVVDSVVANSGRALDLMATWADRRPHEVTVPPQEGAGQMRSIGRVLIASRAQEARRQLVAAVDRLRSVEATSDMRRATAIAPVLGAADHPDQMTLTFIVSSMAGGSGASMALEVSRLLAGLVPAEETTMFMCTPDVFDELPAQVRPGVRPNALAMLGEIVATQMGEANAHDVEFFAQLGVELPLVATPPVARMIPVGRYLASGTPFGDGSMSSVYRGLARAIAALVQSGEGLEQYKANVIENNRPTEHSAPSLFGWGATNTQQIQWGSVGYATVTMGRDRYLEYAAQRLARTAVDHLLDGHLRPGDEDGGIASAKRMVQHQWPSVAASLGLSAEGGTAGLKPWLFNVALPRPFVQELVQAAVSAQIDEYIPRPGQGQEADSYGQAVMTKLYPRRKPFAEAIELSSYSAASAWTTRFVESVEALVEKSVATHGLVYTRFMLDAVRQHLLGDAGASGLRTVSQEAGKPDNVPAKVNELLRSLKGQITNGQVAVIDPVLDAYRRNGDTWLRGAWCSLVATILEDATVGVIDPLIASVNAALRETQAAREIKQAHLGVAALQTDLYSHWPSDGDHEVADRWATAHNEVLLTTPSEFPPRYEHDLAAATQTMIEAAPPTSGEARARAVAAVVSGRWETVGMPAPGGLLTSSVPFVSTHLVKDLETGGQRQRMPSRAVYALHVDTSGVLARSRGYVERRQTSFADFASGSIRDYASDPVLAQHLVLAFQEVLANAVPLSHVPELTFGALHPGSPAVTFSFSTVPFDGLPVTDALLQSVRQFAMASPQTEGNFEKQLDASTDPTRVDVVGYFACAAAPAYNGLLEPAREQWAQSTSPNSRSNYWHNRRARPLPAALAMTTAERRAMIAGWFLGQITGELYLPTRPPYAEPVKVWSVDSGVWLPFPYPMLTPPTSFRRQYDWLPAVLESHLLALSRFGQHPVGSSMAPYVALRSLWDDNPEEPTPLMAGMFQLRAETALSQWLGTGSAPSAGASRVQGVAGMQPEARRAAAIAWVDEIADHVRSEFLPGGAGKFVTIDSASRWFTPMFRDIAPDVDIMLQALKDLLTTTEVQTPEELGGGPFEEPNDLVF